MSTDLQLDVKGCKDVYESFDKYVEVERLEGENKYQAEQFGLQVRSTLKVFFISIFTSCSSLRIELVSGYVRNVSLTVDSRL